MLHTRPQLRNRLEVIYIAVLMWLQVHRRFDVWKSEYWWMGEESVREATGKPGRGTGVR